MVENRVVLVSGSSKGIGRALVEHYAGKECQVIGCSRSPFQGESRNYRHYCLDVADESAVKDMLAQVRKNEGRLDQAQGSVKDAADRAAATLTGTPGTGRRRAGRRPPDACGRVPDLCLSPGGRR